MQLAEGKLRFFNPLTVFLAKRYGGTYEGHKNSIKLYSIMKKELEQVRKSDYFLNAYFYCIGRKK
ncbi:MAG: hypothetical protein JW982_16575 [Spirochaetes bacterium]|nr:hypothetical protein [Spirochaetota bacterium]